MTWNSDVAAKILDKKENIYFIPPDIKYTHRYQIKKAAGTRHLALAKKRVDGVVTAYINRFSINGEPFQDGTINGVSASEFYPIGHKGKTGDVGISSSVARLETLDPSMNEVVRVHIDGSSAFERLVDWYSGKSILLSSPPNRVEEAPEAAPRLEAAIATPDSSKEGPNRQDDPEKRKCTEEYAVKWAKKRYEQKGFIVAERGKPFDLLCTKPGLTVHVEVKGSTGKAVTVTLTRNEVTDAKNQEWRSDLFIVRDITLIPVAGSWQASGGNEIYFEAWRPEEKDLDPIEYEYRVPRIP